MQMLSKIKDGNAIKKLSVYAIAILLLAGTTMGAGIWLMDAEVPIEYDEPYTVKMSQSEVDGYNWQALQFRDSTKLTETADFGATGSGVVYHQYVQIENPEGGANVNLIAEINEPAGFNDQMGFTVLDGIVEPGETSETEVEQWGSINTGDIPVPAGENENFTVIYTLGNNALTSNDFSVNWNFKTGNSITVSSGESIQSAIDSASGTAIFVEDGSYDENLVVDKGVTLYGMNKPTINGRISLSASGAVFEGFDVSPPPATENANAEAIIIQNGADQVSVKNNIVRYFSEDGIPQWEGIDGIVAFGGDENDAIENLEISGNLVKNLEGRNTDGGAAGISIQGNVKDATVEGNEVTNIGMENTAWAFGITVRSTDNHDVTPKNIDVKENTVSTILSDPSTDTVGVGVGLENGDVSEVDFENNDISNTEFLLEDKTTTMNLKKFVKSNTLDQGALLEGAEFNGKDPRNVIFNNIQGAINAADTGDEILAKQGTYTEDLTLNVNGLTLKALSTQAPKVQGQVVFKSDDVTLDGFTVDFSGDPAPIDIGNVINPTVINNQVSGGAGTNGIQSYYGSTGGEIIIENNEVTNGPIGVWSGSYAPDITIKNNDITGAANEGIWFYGGDETITIKGNSVSDVGTDYADMKIIHKPSSVNEELKPELISESIKSNNAINSVLLKWVNPEISVSDLTITSGTAKEFTATVTNEELGYDSVYFDFTIENIDVSDITLEYYDGSNWIEITNLAQDGNDVTGRFGPSGGFEMPEGYNEETRFRVTIQSKGDYNAIIDIYDTVENKLLFVQEGMTITVN